MTPSPEKHMLTVTMGDPAEVVATTPVVGTAMMTAMVMMATIMVVEVSRPWKALPGRFR